MINSFSNKIIVKSPAKINLHLEIIGKRIDGYHELAMIMQNIDIADYLEFENNDQGEIKLTSDCAALGVDDDNLIVKAASQIKELTNDELGANIFLRKKIPIGAGLAGGSSNAASTLLGLNKLWNLRLNYETLHSLSAKLGSDVPFFINGGCQFCFGRGEILEKCKSNLEYGVILLKDPNISISTPNTYKKYSEKFSKKYDMETTRVNKIRKNLRFNKLIDNNTSDQMNKIQNDLQSIVENENDSVKRALNLLSNLQNCLSYSMSGSGPSCFALFKSLDVAHEEYHKNHQKFVDNGFDVWLCKFLDSGITFI